MPHSGIFRNFSHQLELAQRIIDAAVIGLALPMAHWLYFGRLPWDDRYAITAFAAIPLFYLVAKSNNLYRTGLIHGPTQELRPLAVAWFGTLSGLLILGYALKATHELSRFTLGLWALITPLLLVGSRGAMRMILGMLNDEGYSTRSVVIVGAGKSARSLASNILGRPWLGLSLKGFIRTDAIREPVSIGNESYPVLGDVDDLLRLAMSGSVDIVYLAIPMSDEARISGLLRSLGNSTVSIFLVPDLYTADIMQGAWVTIGDTPTVSVIDAPTFGFNSFVKRLEDVVISIVALVLLALPMLLIGSCIKLTSPGSVIYKQSRYGVSGKHITVWKFRTMTAQHSEKAFCQARPEDSRVTKVGRLLRRTSVDELPQLINVLRGDMSIVGPRPHPIELNEQFREKIMGYMLRHKVKPGMTGLAQINGYRGETDTEDKMENRIRYDIEYIHNWTIWLDLAIMLKTPWAVIHGDNAY